MSKLDINNNINDFFLKKFKKIKIESPIHNLSETSFKYRQKKSLDSNTNNTNNTNKLPILKKQENQKMNSSLIDNSKESKTYLLNLKKNYNSSLYVNNGIVWYNKNKIKIPRLIIPQGNINSLNNSNLSTDRRQFLSQIKNKMKINNNNSNNNNNLYSTKRMEELFLPKDSQKQINEVLKIKNDNNNNNSLIFDRKENKVFELLLKKLGINKNNEDKIIKKISVGMLNQKKIPKKKTKNIRKNIRNFRINFYDRYNSLKYFEKDCHKIDLLSKNNNSIIMKKNQSNEKRDKKIREKDIDIEEKIRQFKKIHFKNINNAIRKISVEFKSIDNKLNECFLNAKDNFENEMKKEFSDCNY